MFIGHYGVSLPAKRVDARLCSGRLMVAVRELPGIFVALYAVGFWLGRKQTAAFSPRPSRAFPR
jgi:hypothetical protein